MGWGFLQGLQPQELWVCTWPDTIILEARGAGRGPGSTASAPHLYRVHHHSRAPGNLWGEGDHERPAARTGPPGLKPVPCACPARHRDPGLLPTFCAQALEPPKAVTWDWVSLLCLAVLVIPHPARQVCASLSSLWNSYKTLQPQDRRDSVTECQPQTVLRMTAARADTADVTPPRTGPRGHRLVALPGSVTPRFLGLPVRRGPTSAPTARTRQPSFSGPQASGTEAGEEPGRTPTCAASASGS